MRIVYNCPKCQKVNRIKESASDRYKLSEKIGTEIDVECSRCHQKSKIHINRVYAKVDPVTLSLVILILSASSFLIGNYLFQNYWRDGTDNLEAIEVIGVGFLIPVFILSIAIPSLSKRANYFNSYRL